MLHKCEVLLLLIELSSQEFLLVMPSSELSYWAGQKPSLSLPLPLASQWHLISLVMRKGVTMAAGWGV